jgi:hypothetical protein
MIGDWAAREYYEEPAGKDKQMFSEEHNSRVSEKFSQKHYCGFMAGTDLRKVFRRT